VIDRLGESSGMTSVLLGSPDERDLCDRIAARCRTSPMNLAGQTPLRIMAAIISRAAVVLCHDSAPMHLAAALDRPLVALFGPTNPARTGPYSARARVLQMALPCAPCYLRKLEQCGYSHECMKSIEAQAVVCAAIDSFQAGKS
jgi:ADP-heptose:LPS heptosyltransferase